MTDEDLGFLRAINAAWHDPAPRLIYADWLDERDDPRAEHLRHACRLAELPPGHPDAPALAVQLATVRRQLPADWLAAVGDYRSTGAEPDPNRIAAAAALLGRPAIFTDGDGYEMSIEAAVQHPVGGAIAYVEWRRKQLSRREFDVDYYLRIRDGGREACSELETYDPLFGCHVKFFEWFGSAAFVIYRGKRRMYACRFDLEGAEFKEIEYSWLLDGPQLFYREYDERQVRRMAVPSLRDLPELSEAEAALWGVVPLEHW